MMYQLFFVDYFCLYGHPSAPRRQWVMLIQISYRTVVLPLAAEINHFSRLMMRGV
uniref:Uncharacterized protein n=1 Tax=Aegilops tauschii subsp. strangulata TaxID=200361 RepID=A0A453CT81_AEGTS